MMEEEFEQLRDVLTRQAYKLTRNQSDAEDLVQEAYVCGLKNRDKFREGSSLGSWLSTILRCRFIDRYRRKQTAREVGADDFEAFGLVGATATALDVTGMDAGEIATNPEFLNSLDDDLVDGLALMNERQRDVLLLSAVGELSGDEIAAKLGIPRGSVSSSLQRARLFLQKHTKGAAVTTETIQPERPDVAPPPPVPEYVGKFVMPRTGQEANRTIGTLNRIDIFLMAIAAGASKNQALAKVQATRGTFSNWKLAYPAFDVLYDRARAYRNAHGGIVEDDDRRNTQSPPAAALGDQPPQPSQDDLDEALANEVYHHMMGVREKIEAEHKELLRWATESYHDDLKRAAEFRDREIRRANELRDAQLKVLEWMDDLSIKKTDAA